MFFNLTIDNKDLPDIIKVIKEKEQKFGLFYNGLSNEEYLQYNPDYILFPLFSTVAETHDLYTGKKTFYRTISFLNSLPRKIKKSIIFFVTKDNISETTELSSLMYSLKTKAHIQPISFYSQDDFDKETLLYLQRIANQKNISLLGVANKKAHCINWIQTTNIYHTIYDKIRYYFLKF